AIVVLMNYYIDDVYSDFAVDYFINTKSDFYYVNMAAAWALSVAFVKYRDKVMPAIENGRLTDEIHNMTISKIRDSFRVDKETKAYLKDLRR
ncbi:MAG: DNA alkylation repair protein, partial [Eubacterium sp.]|nr:DNA alkylation repair protein [Eubacterium sp.]